eukprot:scaffold2053_cov342-Prasinococcus_capsulatus_cf.AAC.4
MGNALRRRARHVLSREPSADSKLAVAPGLGRPMQRRRPRNHSFRHFDRPGVYAEGRNSPPSRSPRQYNIPSASMQSLCCRGPGSGQNASRTSTSLPPTLYICRRMALA